MTWNELKKRYMWKKFKILNEHRKKLSGKKWKINFKYLHLILKKSLNFVMSESTFVIILTISYVLESTSLDWHQIEEEILFKI